eukprot:g5315.t1
MKKDSHKRDLRHIAKVVGADAMEKRRAELEELKQTIRSVSKGTNEMPDSMLREVFYASATIFEDPDKVRDEKLQMVMPTRIPVKFRKGCRINPDEPWKQGWDIILMMAIMYSVIVVPYRLAFSDEASGFTEVLENLIDLFFFFDIILNFLTAYEDADTRTLEWSLSKIRNNYLKTWFTIDFLSTIPFDKIGKYF